MGYHKIHLKITVKVLAELYDRSEYTINKWIREGALDPSSMDTMIAKYMELKDNRGSSAPHVQ